MDEIKISILIPVYNGERFIRRAIHSAINQSYTGRYEIIVLDDGSTDGTSEICKEYAAKYSNVKYIYQKNVGISQTRERAVKLALGKYICWIDADDEASPDLLKETMEKIEDTGADICVYSNQNIYTDGRVKNNVRTDLSLEEWQKQTITGQITAVWSYVCKKELWKDETFPWQVWRYGEDALITPIIFRKAKKITSVATILYYYKVDNPYSMTHNYSGPKLMGAGYVLYERFKFSLEKYPDVVEHLGNKTIRLFSRAYCVSSYLKDLKEDEREMVRSYILDTADHMDHIPFRNAYRVFLVRYRWNRIIELMGRLTCNARNKRNKKAKELMK